MLTYITGAWTPHPICIACLCLLHYVGDAGEDGCNVGVYC